jgi:phospholipid/cholesterol/gamma-HCH transport system permease protein
MPVNLKIESKTDLQHRILNTANPFLNSLKNFFDEVACLSLFILRFFKEFIKPPYEFREFLKQSYLIGYKSLPIVVITGFIMGLVLTLQTRPTLADFGAESWLPGMVALSLIREISPVITALICAGKISSGIGAELGSMKVTQQIDAMEVSAINPYKYLVVTRIMATTLMVPLLVVFADAVGVLGGYAGINIHGDVNFFRYFSQVLASLDFIDLVPATIKTFFFGFFIGMIGCYKGFTAANGTESVGKAATSAVVAASLAIFIIDMLAAQLTDMFF